MRNIHRLIRPFPRFQRLRWNLDCKSTALILNYKELGEKKSAVIDDIFIIRKWLIVRSGKVSNLYREKCGEFSLISPQNIKIQPIN